MNPPRHPFKNLLDPTESKAAVLRPKEFKRLLVIAGEGANGKRNTSIVWHSFGSALRISEIAHLKVKDVLERSGKVKEMAKLPAAYTKNGKARAFIQVEPDQREAIDAYANERVEKRQRMSKKPGEYRDLQPDSPFYLARNDAGFAFNHKIVKKADGTELRYLICSSMQNLLTKLIKDIGVTGGSSHSGRRTFATRLSERGADDTLIQALLGHGDVQMTMVYIEANMDLISKAVARIYPGL